MASTATAFFPGASSFPNTTQYPGQGLAPIPRCRLSFDDASDSTPTWVEVANSKSRAFGTSRGRESPLQQHDAGSATVVLDNRNRDFDPTNTASPYYPNVTPMVRIWLYEEFSGEVHDLFRGYVESWDQEWPGGGWSDAIVTLACADEFKVLALDGLPTTSPVRDNFEDVIGSDLPSGYWRFNDDPIIQIQAPSDPDPNPVPPQWHPGLFKTPKHGKGWT
jgi:hypothetical protein